MNNNTPLERSTVIAVMMTSFLTTFIGSSTNLALPSIGRDFHSSALVLSWIVTGFILASAAFLLPMGRLADLVGRRKIFLVGAVFFTIFTFLCAVSWSNKSIILFRVLQGIAGSMIYATAMALLTSVIPAQRRGKAMGLAVTATYIGLSLGPVAGGAMCYHLGWRSIFYFTALVGFMVTVFIMVRLKGEWVGAEGETFDFTGSFFYMTGVVAVLYGISTISSEPWAPYVLITGLVLMTGFVIYELKTTHPLLHIKLFTENVSFAFSNLAAMINYSATFAIGFLLSLYLQIILGYSAQAAGLILLAQPIVMASFSSYAGALSDRIEPRIVASWGMALSALGLFNFIFLSSSTPVWLIVPNLTLVGLGFALFSSPNTNAIMGSVEEKFYGVASSSVATMRMIGMATSMAVVTLLISLYVGDVGLNRTHSVELLKSFKMAFTVCSILCFGGVFASLARGNIRASVSGGDKKL
ncbi:MAG: MFS transporter [Deltaproteobacteria bacterium]|nr:MFS transporter [Deltaproteobacteria bacterium]